MLLCYFFKRDCGVNILKYKRIRELREDNDLTQKQVADKLYMHLTQYRRYETGERELPLETAAAIAKIYGVSIDYIAENDGLNGDGVQFGLTTEEVNIIRKYRKLSKINKARINERLDTLCAENNK